MDEGPVSPRPKSTGINATAEICSSSFDVTQNQAVSASVQPHLESNSHPLINHDLRHPHSDLDRGEGSSADQVPSEISGGHKSGNIGDWPVSSAGDCTESGSDDSLRGSMDIEGGSAGRMISDSGHNDLGEEPDNISRGKDSLGRNEGSVNKERVESGSGDPKREEKGEGAKSKNSEVPRSTADSSAEDFKSIEPRSTADSSTEDSKSIEPRSTADSSTEDSKSTEPRSTADSSTEDSKNTEPRSTADSSTEDSKNTEDSKSTADLSTEDSKNKENSSTHSKNKVSTNTEQKSKNLEMVSKNHEMEPQSIESSPLNHIQPFPPGFRLAPALELPIEPSEIISCFACHEANLYIGTSLGKLLHLHFFEDASEYMLIMQLSVNEARDPIQKIVLLPDAEVSLVLCNKIVSAFTFPELSPCHIGKIRNVQDMSVLSQGQKSKSENAHLDKIIVYTQARIRLVQISKSAVKLLKDINYSDATTGVSTACNMQANYSKICLVANSHSYEVVDMQKPQKIPLFQYNPGAVGAVHPYILPFTKPGANTEEYLLPICTDEQSSMAMFTNSSGDATRGTLTWPNLGYPTNGLVVEWPYVFGLFKQEGYMQYVASSLESLQPVSTCQVSEISQFSQAADLQIWSSVEGVRVWDKHLSSLSAQVYYTSGELYAGARNHYDTSHTLFCSGTALHCLVKPSALADKVQALMQDFESFSCASKCGDFLSNYTEYFSGQKNALCQSLYWALLVICEDFDRLKVLIDAKTDVRLLLLFAVKNVEDEDDFWASYTLPRVVRDLHILWRKRGSGDYFSKSQECQESQESQESRDNHSNNHFYSQNIHYSQKSRDFVLWLIQTVLKSDKFDIATSQKFREYSYTIASRNSSEIIQKIHSESNIWSGQNELNSSLMQFFEKNHFYVALIEVYLIKQSAGNQFLPWDEKIIDACLNLLSGKWKNSAVDSPSLEAAKITIKNGKSLKTYDLGVLICSSLNKISDEKVYAKKLVDFVALEAEQGLRFLQKNSKGRLHSQILQQVTRSLEFDSNLPFLKAQYIEQSFQEMVQVSKSFASMDFAIARELLDEYMHYLNQPDLQQNYEALDALFQAFQGENDLADPKWPKVTWMEFLSLNLHSAHCADFFRTWLKANELLLLLSCSCSKQKLPNFKYHGPAVAYSQVAYTSGTDKVTYFLEIGDYTSAEHSALYAVAPLPRGPILLKQMVSKFRLDFPAVGASESSDLFESIVSFYLQLSDKTCRNYAVMHIVEAFGTLVFGIDRILSFLPDDFPLMYVERFLETTLLDLEEKRGQVVMKKAMAKMDSKMSGAVVREFEEKIIGNRLFKIED